MVSEIEFWGKKVGDQCIFILLLMLNPSNDFRHFASKSQEDFNFSNPIFTSDLEIGFLASRNGSSGHLLN